MIAPGLMDALHIRELTDIKCVNYGDAKAGQFISEFILCCNRGSSFVDEKGKHSLLCAEVGQSHGLRCMCFALSRTTANGLWRTSPFYSKK